jgi:hypothetical protein
MRLFMTSISSVNKFAKPTMQFFTTALLGATAYHTVKIAANALVTCKKVDPENSLLIHVIKLPAFFSLSPSMSCAMQAGVFCALAATTTVLATIAAKKRPLQPKPPAGPSPRIRQQMANTPSLVAKEDQLHTKPRPPSIFLKPSH